MDGCSGTVAVGIVCKVPQAGRSKTRLSPPLTPDQCETLSACFIKDVASTIYAAAGEAGAACYAIYTPAGLETELTPLLPESFKLLAQSEGDLGARLIAMTHALFAAGHRGVVLVNADGPTLPHSILRDAIALVGQRDAAVIGPALDGGYTLIGLSRPHDDLFTGIPWSTPEVYTQTRMRASRLNLPVVALPLWYDVDDADDLRVLRAELAGEALHFARPGLVGAPAHATRTFLAQHRHAGVSLVS